MTLTKKMKALSEANQKLSYFMYKGEMWKLVGTKCNYNGTYTHSIRNRNGDRKEVGNTVMDKILNNQ